MKPERICRYYDPQFWKIIEDLVGYGVEFEKDGEAFAYTREGAHSRPRILFHADVTGKEITSKLLARVREKNNVTIYEYTTMTDILEENGKCAGITVKTQSGEESSIYADYTILASGGIGGLYQHSTNFPHLTGDALEVAKNITSVWSIWIMYRSIRLHCIRKSRADDS